MCTCASGNDCGGLTCGEGPAGIDGLNSFTVTTADFTVPTIGQDVTINVSALGQATGIWARAGQEIFIATAGYYRVVSATATVIVATNVGATGNAAATTVIAIGSGVSPGGREGVAGATGATGAAGADGTTELVTLFSATAVSSTSFSNLHTAQTLSANLFATVGDVLRITVAGVAEIVPGNNNTNHWRYEHKITLDGVDIVLPASNPYLATRSYSPYNGFFAEIDIIPLVVGATPTFIVNVNKFITGLGGYSGTNGYAVIPSSTNTPVALGNAFAAGYTTGVNQATAFDLQVVGRRQQVGTPTGTPNMYLPMLKVELLKK